ncbi:MAG TPA: hypothetical protein VIU12_08555 [Chryseolinea sp.]
MPKSTKPTDTLENIVHEVLKSVALIFPISDEDVKEFENKFTMVPLPEKLKNSEDILTRNRDAIQAVHQPELRIASLWEMKEPKINKRKNTNTSKTSKKKKK